MFANFETAVGGQPPANFSPAAVEVVGFLMVGVECGSGGEKVAGPDAGGGFYELRVRPAYFLVSVSELGRRGVCRVSNFILPP